VKLDEFVIPSPEDLRPHMEEVQARLKEENDAANQLEARQFLSKGLEALKCGAKDVCLMDFPSTEVRSLVSNLFQASGWDVENSTSDRLWICYPKKPEKPSELPRKETNPPDSEIPTFSVRATIVKKYHLDFDFVDVENRKGNIHCTSWWGMGFQGLKVGDEIEVIYFVTRIPSEPLRVIGGRLLSGL